MKVNLLVDENYYNSVKRMLGILLPDLDISKSEGDFRADITVVSELSTSAEGIKVVSYIKGNDDFKEEIEDLEILDNSYSKQDFKRRSKERVKLSIYRLLSSYLGKDSSPWGILIGVRPTKIGHRLLDQGFSYQKIEEIFKEVYGLQEEKVELLVEVIKKERKYLPTKEEARKKVSIYLGIPFCPTRCSYCSFAAYSLEKHGHYLTQFLETLEYEIKEIGKLINRLEVEIDTVYIGGGTPTVLSASQLEDLMAWLEDNFSLDDLREFSVEAGRADTITRAKLEVLKGAGVDRISINPQTMNQATLKEIGRNHSVEEVQEAFSLARELGFDNINMDLILGLPKEGLSELEKTLTDIKDLKPDSLTLHTMAIKRASKLKLNDDSLASAKEVEEMLRLAKETASKLELLPYYMYRQKYMLGNLENVGYSKLGKESIYNILMMEERETVIALGGGAISKVIDPSDWSLERLLNPKCPAQYIEEIEKRIDKKRAKLTSLLR